MTHQVESEATKYSDRQRKLLTPFEFYPKYYCPKHYVKQGSWKSIFWWSIWTKKYPNYLAWTPPIDSTYFHSILRCTCGAMPLNIMVIYQTLSTFLQGVRVWCKNPKIFRALTRLAFTVSFSNWIMSKKEKTEEEQILPAPVSATCRHVDLGLLRCRT